MGALGLRPDQRDTLCSAVVLLVLLEAWFDRAEPTASITIGEHGSEKRVHALPAIREVLGRWGEQDLSTALGIDEPLPFGGEGA